MVQIWYIFLVLSLATTTAKKNKALRTLNVDHIHHEDPISDPKFKETAEETCLKCCDHKGLTHDDNHECGFLELEWKDEDTRDKGEEAKWDAECYNRCVNHHCNEGHWERLTGCVAHIHVDEEENEHENEHEDDDHDDDHDEPAKH